MPVFIHVGVPKSGTSTLQLRVFPNHPQIDFRSWPGYGEMPAMHDFIYGENQYQSPELLARCRKEIAEATADASKPVLFSREHLTHEIFDKGMIAEKLKSAFGDFKLILTIREQRSMLESQFLWNQRTIRRPWAGGIPARSIDDYLAGQWKALKSIKRSSRLTTGDYAAIVRKYVELVGRDNVGVFVFEEMAKSPADFCRKLFGFLDVDADLAAQLLSGRVENQRLTQWEYRYWQGLAYLTPPPVNKVVQRVMPDLVLRALKKGPPMRARLSDEWRNRLGDFYADGNRYLANEFSLPLQQYGYAL